MGVRITSFYQDVLTIWRKTSSVDAHGVAVEAFTAHGTLWARVDQKSGNERPADGRQEHQAMLDFECDEDSDLILSDRVAWDRDPGWLFEVTAINKAHRQWDVEARRVTR